MAHLVMLVMDDCCYLCLIPICFEGLATGWKQNGGLRIAATKDRMVELKRQATMAHSFGLDVHLLTPKEAKQLYPLLDETTIEGAAFLPGDGQANVCYQNTHQK